MKPTTSLIILFAVQLSTLACWDPLVREVFSYEPGSSGPDSIGLGDPCMPGDEHWPNFSGFSTEELNLSSRDAQCASSQCLVKDFQGRVSCPEGNLDGGECFTPLGELVTVPVPPALPESPAESSVICTCRCDGPSGQGPFCDCPSGMACEPLIRGGNPEYAGSYCVWP